MSTLQERMKNRPRLGEPVFVEEWGETVYVRGLSLTEAKQLRDVDDNLDSLTIHVLHGVVDADGAQVFETAEQVNGMELPAIRRLGQMVQDATLKTPTADEVDEAEGNSEGTSSQSSSTASPSSSAAPSENSTPA